MHHEFCILVFAKPALLSCSLEKGFWILAKRLSHLFMRKLHAIWFSAPSRLKQAANWFVEIEHTNWFVEIEHINLSLFVRIEKEQDHQRMNVAVVIKQSSC